MEVVTLEDVEAFDQDPQATEEEPAPEKEEALVEESAPQEAAPVEENDGLPFEG